MGACMRLQRHWGRCSAWYGQPELGTGSIDGTYGQSLLTWAAGSMVKRNGEVA